MRSLSVVPAALLVAASGVGCVRETSRPFVLEPEPEPAREPTQVRQIDVPSEDDDEEAEPASDSLVTAAVVPTARGARQVAPDPILFRLGAGYGALGHVDLAPCRDQGLPQGYLRLRVTFRASGRVVRAAVETPVAPPAEALTCIGEQLEMAMVPLFEGGDVTLSKSFFVN